LREFEGFYQKDSAAFWVMKENAQIVGTVGVIAEGEEAEVVRLFVDPNARGYGLGQRLGEAAVEWARHKGLRRARIWINSTASHAQAVSTNMGFKKSIERQLQDVNQSHQIAYDMELQPK